MSNLCPKVSIIMPIRNASQWLSKCLSSVQAQTYTGPVQLSVYNDGSSDESMQILHEWCSKWKTIENHDVVISGHEDYHNPKGVGFAKNEAIRQSDGQFLCFLDADDEMRPKRIELQLKEAEKNKNAIIGCQFIRDPVDSTLRYTLWANKTNDSQLYHQIYTSHGPTLIMPTWFCSRNVYDRVGAFSEEGKGTPEDLIFFYQHLDIGGQLVRVNQELMVYKYHIEQTTFSIDEDTIWKIRFKRMEEKVLSEWKTLTIWSAGKEGKKFYRSLKEENRKKVIAFVDVDEKKIKKGFYTFEETNIRPKPKVPIIRYKDIIPPLIICVKLGLTNGQMESYLSSLDLEEGKDYYHF